MGPPDPEDEPPQTRVTGGRDLPQHVQKQLDELEELFGDEVEKDEEDVVRGPLIRAPLSPQRPRKRTRNGLFVPTLLRTRAPRHRRRKRIRKSLLVVLIIIALVAGGSLLAVLSPLPGSGQIRVDGAVSDWSGVRSYSSDPLNARPDIDIVSFSFYANGVRLSFLVKVSGTALAGGPAEPDRGDAFHFFVDLDAKRESGYSVAGIGADLAVRVTGRSGKVSSAELLRFAGLDQQNFTEFSPSGPALAAAAGGALEVQIPLDPGLLPGDAAFSVVANGNDDSSDSLGYPVSLTRPTLFVRQEAPAGPFHSKQKGVELATLTLSATSPITVSSLSLRLTGPVANAAADVGTGAVENGYLVIRNIAVSGPTVVHVSGDLDSAADQAVAGARVESAGDVSGVLIALVDAPARDSLKYVAFVPSVPLVDGAFGDWTAPAADPAGDSGGAPRVDLTGFAISRSGNSLSVYARVDGSMFAGAEVPYHSPLVIFQAPKPGNGSGVPTPLPRASGEDRMAAMIDTDGNPDTGLLVGNIGVDAALMAGGREGLIAYSGLYTYLGGLGAQAQWSRIGGAAVNLDSAQWEGSADLSGLNLQPTLKVLFAAESWDSGFSDETSPLRLKATHGFSEPSQSSSKPDRDRLETNRGSGGPPAPVPNAIEGTLDVNVGTTASTTTVGGTPNTWRAQSFTTTYDTVIREIDVLLCDTTSDAITQELQTDSAGAPSGTVVASWGYTATQSASCPAPPTNFHSNAVLLNPRYFRSGTVLWIVLKVATGAAIAWASSVNLNDVYSGGQGAAYDSTTSGPWTFGGNDRNFQIYGAETHVFEDNVEIQTKTDRWDVAGTAGVWENGTVDPGGADGLPNNEDHTTSSGAGANKLWGTNLGGNYPDSASATLTSNYAMLISGTQPVLSFWHHYDTEKDATTDWDGGRVRIQNDSSIGWTAATVATPVGSYPCADVFAFGSGMNPGYCGQSLGWKRAVFDLRAHAGHTIKIRFDFASDTSLNLKGWYIDDIRIGEAIELLEAHTFGTGTAEYLRLYNFGPFNVDLSSWTVISAGGARALPSTTINSGATYDFVSTAGLDWYADAGDYVLLRSDVTITTINGTGVAPATSNLRVDYLQYGSYAGVPPYSYSLLWTGSNPGAPSSSSQYLARVSDGSFSGVDTGDGADWVMIPEFSASPWMAAGPAALCLVLLASTSPARSRKKRSPRSH